MEKLHKISQNQFPNTVLKMTLQKAANQYSDYRVRNKVTSDNDKI